MLWSYFIFDRQTPNANLRNENKQTLFIFIHSSMEIKDNVFSINFELEWHKKYRSAMTTEITVIYLEVDIWY